MLPTTISVAPSLPAWEQALYLICTCEHPTRGALVGRCRAEGWFNDSTKDEDLMCMNQTVMMCDFAISRYCNKHTNNTPLKRQASCFHQTVTISTAAAALRLLNNNRFSGTIPASLASSTSLRRAYVPYADQIQYCRQQTDW